MRIALDQIQKGVRSTMAVDVMTAETDRLERLAREFADFGRLPEGPQSEVGEFPRSEEHTSELQSHLNLVCRLLLEKKKKEPRTCTRNRRRHRRRAPVPRRPPAPDCA